VWELVHGIWKTQELGNTVNVTKCDHYSRTVTIKRCNVYNEVDNHFPPFITMYTEHSTICWSLCVVNDMSVILLMGC